MNGKNVAISYGENGKFAIERTNAKGKIDRELVDGAKVSEVTEAVRFAVNAAKGQETATNHWQSLVCLILAMPIMDGSKGKGDRLTGKTADTFKDALRKAEDAFFDQCAADKVRGIPTDADARLDLVRKVRNDKNYSNIKSTCAKYFAFIGAIPVTDAGYLVPRAVMLAHIASVLNIQNEDTSLHGRIRAMIAEAKKIDKASEAYALIVACKELLAMAESRKAYADEIATNAAHGLPVNAGDTSKVLSEIAKVSKPAAEVTPA